MLFLILLFLIFYSYMIFPLVLAALRPFARRRFGHGRVEAVTVVCAVHNEEKIIAQKIHNFYALEYPVPPRLFLGLDGCSDGTRAQIEGAVKDGRVQYFQFPRQGKAQTLNALMEKVSTPYSVMTDANSMFDADALLRLAETMSDETGVVCGRLVLVDSLGNSGEGLYWRYETMLKKFENAFGSVMGANGAIYMLRSALYEKLPMGTINDDFSISMKIYEKGHAMRYAAAAVAREEAGSSDADEFSRHVRDGAGHYRALVYLCGMLNPLRPVRFFFYVSHRVLRWMAPFSMIALYVISCLRFNEPAYRLAWFAQSACYGAVAAVHFLKTKPRLLRIPYYFVLINGALLAGFVKLCTGRQQSVWVPLKR
ncbi:MAG: hypothetical protein A2219_03435 [Elusimicrobia bacterium RIFOXYA2_FULL_50_26]|nr:MAG: hypothetical protein A2219_03435 [Elusimicrobia bacterium RIFOXYA2_FULL_50_26]OGS25349.1 MAG: hypothetical protein A2314_06425 [Elusimicrobia bacterium RIFOXYB2_FULL_50_12]